MKKLVLLLCCFSLPLCCFSQGEECESLYNSAISYYNNGDYSSALVFFKRVKLKCGDYRDVSNKITESERLLDGENKPAFSSISVDKNNVSFGPQGGTETIKVNGDASWSWGKRPDWIKLSKSKGRLVVECEGNATGENREADISIVGGDGAKKKIHVSQSRSTLSVSPRSIAMGEYGGATYLVNVNSNDDWNVVVPLNSWIVIKETNNGVSVSCEENPFAIERRGSFEVITAGGESVEISAVQRPSKPKLELEPTVHVAWNAEESYILFVDSNDPNWSSIVVSGGGWCKIVKQEDRQLTLSFKENNTDYSREAKIRISSMNMSKEVTITQGVNGYMALYADYFQNIGGKRRITPISASIYGIGSYGLRVSGFMVRWKVAELDLLNLNTSFSKTFLLSWEPMIRGYLPLQRNKNFWTAYLGVGGCVPLVDVPLKPDNNRNHSNILVEMGAECNLKWKNYENLSARMFLRIDGYFSIGVALSMFNWK